MNLTLDLAVMIQAVLGGAILVAIRWAVNTLTANLRDISESLVDLKGRTTRMESWQSSHDKQDDERYHTFNEAVEKVWVKLDGLR